MKKIRLAVVSSHPIQHFTPLYAELAKAQNIQLKVFFLAENGVTRYADKQFGTDVQWDIPLTSGYDFQFVEPGKVIKNFDFFSMDSKNLVAALQEFAPGLIWLHGYGQRANWRVLLRKQRGVAIIYSSDSNLSDSRSRWRKAIKKVAIKIFFSRCDYFLSISPSNRAYLRHYGAPENKVRDSTFPVDITRLQSDKAKLPDTSKQELGEKLNLPEGAIVILFVGKLIVRKRPADVLKAISGINLPMVTSVIVGSGELLDELRALAIDLGIEKRVRFTGFVNQAQLAQYFDLADILVFPSKNEPYGTIAAESLPFGLPMVVASGVGAIGASVIEGQNALLYRAGDVAQLTRQLRLLIDDADLRTAFAKSSLNLAQAHDKSVMARDIIDICKACATHPLHH